MIEQKKTRSIIELLMTFCQRLTEIITHIISDLETLEKVLIMTETEDKRLTLSETLSLTHGQIVYSLFWDNADNTPERWRVNGMVKTWKRDPLRVRVPVKRGLWQYDYLTEDNLSDFSLSEDYASQDHVKSDMRRVKVRFKSDNQTLLSYQTMIRDHLRDFDSDSGHTWIMGQLTQEDRQDLDRLLTGSQMISQYLDMILIDLESLEMSKSEDLDSLLSGITESQTESLRLKIIETVSHCMAQKSDLSLVISQRISQRLQPKETI